MHELQIKLPNERFYRTVETVPKLEVAELFSTAIKQEWPAIHTRINSDEIHRSNNVKY